MKIMKLGGNFRKFSLITLVLGFVSFLFLVELSGSSFATNFSLTFSPTGYYLNLSSSGDINLDLNPSTNSGLASGSHTILTKTNLPSGYKLYLSTNEAGESGNKLKRKTTPEHFLSPTSGTSTSPTPLTDNTWGYATTPATTPNLPTNFDTTYTTPNPAPSSKWAKVPSSDQAALIDQMNEVTFDPNNPSLTGKSLPIYYGAKVNTTIPAGEYQTTLVYSAIANTNTAPNATVNDNYTGSVYPSTINNLAGGETITITTSLYTTGDVGEVTVLIDNQPCTNVVKYPAFNIELKVACKTPPGTPGLKNISVSIPKYSVNINIDNGITYNQQRTFNNITTMQQMAPEICEAETTPHAFQNGQDSNPIVSTTTRLHSADKNLVPEAELTDTRDNKTYIVRKLADGKCWMVQNLDLDLNTSTTLTNQNTDLNSKASWTPNNSTQNNTGTSWGDAYNTSNQARSYNPGDKYLTGTGSGDQTVSDSGPKTAHNGNLYNWYAATAGSGTYDMTTPGQEAQDSICPKGWKLPYGNNSESDTADSGDFRKLTNTYGITTGASNTSNISLADRLLSAPLNFIRSGYYYYSNGQFYGQGSNGYFWSSSVSSQSYAHSLLFSYSYVDPQYGRYKGYGFAVRCVIRLPLI